MTNHLMSVHASPTALTLGTHPGQSVEHFGAVSYFAESFQSEMPKCTIKKRRAKEFYITARSKSAAQTKKKRDHLTPQAEAIIGNDEEAMDGS
jgi:hypothetical protein